MTELFKPDEGTIDIIPTGIHLGYTNTQAQEEAVSIYFDTPNLGTFNFLISPEAVPVFTAELTKLFDNLDVYRREYVLKYGGGQ